MNTTVTPAFTHLVPLAEELDKNKVTPGVLGFIVFAVLGVAVWMLMKNMNKQFGKISFDEKATGKNPGRAPSGQALEADAEDGGSQGVRPAPAAGGSKADTARPDANA